VDGFVEAEVAQHLVISEYWTLKTKYFQILFITLRTLYFMFLPIMHFIYWQRGELFYIKKDTGYLLGLLLSITVKNVERNIGFMMYI
jgi:hypothetical protein